MHFNSPKIWYPLIPFSWLYGIVVYIRNFLFDCGILPSSSYDMPVISIGNITVGGTGKTPLTEYLVRLLSPNHQVGIVSRGYKRKTKGTIIASSSSKMSDIGDEPYQMKHKYPQVHVVVDESRCRGIEKICSPQILPATDVVLLDDAFQHRYVQPGISIVLMDYNRMPYNDYLLPAGRLREPKSSCERADIVIVTKCPTDITPTEEHGIERSLSLQPWQKLYYTHYEYKDLRPMSWYMPGSSNVSGFMESESVSGGITLEELSSNKYRVVLLTGIASPHQLEEDFGKFCPFTAIRFDDHHSFTPEDIKKIWHKITSVGGDSLANTIVVTTEKDAVRLADYHLNNPSDEVPFIQNRFSNFFVLPVEVKFKKGLEEDFNKIISGFVSKNSRTSRLF